MAIILEFKKKWQNEPNKKKNSTDTFEALCVTSPNCITASSAEVLIILNFVEIALLFFFMYRYS